MSFNTTTAGNVCVWKPSETAVLANWVTYKIFREAGLPDGVVNFLPGPGPAFGEASHTPPLVPHRRCCCSCVVAAEMWQNKIPLG